MSFFPPSREERFKDVAWLWPDLSMFLVKAAATTMVLVAVTTWLTHLRGAHKSAHPMFGGQSLALFSAALVIQTVVHVVGLWVSQWLSYAILFPGLSLSLTVLSYISLVLVLGLVISGWRSGIGACA